jgi:hypothetical protein
MSQHARYALTLTIFGLTALVGPAVRFLNWPPGPDDTFVYDLVLLLWPTQPLAAVEASIGTFPAAIIAIGTNVLLFAIFGIVAAVLAAKRLATLAVYALALGLVLLLHLWGTGFDLTYSNGHALAAAYAIYAIPFGSAALLAGHSC